jgi:hypothetical protein
MNKALLLRIMDTFIVLNVHFSSRKIVLGVQGFFEHSKMHFNIKDAYIRNGCKSMQLIHTGG